MPVTEGESLTLIISQLCTVDDVHVMEYFVGLFQVTYSVCSSLQVWPFHTRTTLALTTPQRGARDLAVTLGSPGTSVSKCKPFCTPILGSSYKQ